MLESLLGTDLINEVKKVIYYHYLNDKYFPESCGSISMVLATVFEKSKLKDKYDIVYNRGYFKDEAEYDYCYCDFSDMIDSNHYTIENFPCGNCDCEYMIPHSWITLVSSTETIILDFTSIQFDEDCRYELRESEMNIEELYNYIYKNRNFVILENNKLYKNYINLGKTQKAKDIINKVEEVISEGERSEFTILLDKIGYK